MPNGLLLPSLALVGQPWMALIKTRMGTTSSNLWSRSALDVVGGWNEDLASSQDYDLMFRLLKNSGSIAWDAHIRTHVLKRASGSISQTGVQANWDRYIALRRAIMEYLRTLDPERRTRDRDTAPIHIHGAAHCRCQDPPKAIEEYRQSIGHHFKPEVGRATNGSDMPCCIPCSALPPPSACFSLRNGTNANSTHERSYAHFQAFREADRIALRLTFSVHLMYDEVWKFQRLLRRVE
ncbi:MAG: hypothetical protein IPO90_07055 [Flavobacteriales bacterium]|nr:hypothetical protein [Flavobacteriales bacterium]